MKREARDINLNVRDINVWKALKLVNLGASTEDQGLHCLEAGRMRKN